MPRDTWEKYAERVYTNVIAPSETITNHYIVSLVFASFIFVHSCYLHKFNYRVERVCTELSTVLNMVKISLILPCFLRQCNSTEIAGLIVIGHNLALFLFQIIDNFWTYYIYRFVCNRKITWVFSIVVFLYVSLALYTWIVYSVVVPAFVSDDSTTLADVDLQYGLIILHTS